MQRLRQIFLHTALVWAFVAPFVVLVRISGDLNVARSLLALAGGWPEASKEDRVILGNLARDEITKDHFVMSIVLVSSAVVVVLCLVSMTRIDRETHVT